MSLPTFSMHSPPTLPWNGVVILGEAPGAEEEAQKVPFIGPSGKLLNGLLRKAGVERDACHVLNVFSERPPNNSLANWQVSKKEAGPEYPYGVMPKNKYLNPEKWPHLDRLWEELHALQPRLVVGTGAIPLWAITGFNKISGHRGTFFRVRKPGLEFDFLATFHPSYLLQGNWSDIPIVVADLQKVRRYLRGNLPAPLPRTFFIDPSWEEIEEAYHGLLERKHYPLGVDIETVPSIDQITTISFSTEEYGICIPFWNKDAKPGEKLHYWDTPEEEARAWEWVQRFADLPHEKVFHNGLYDVTFSTLCEMPIRFHRVSHDTALLSHAIQPEISKALGMCGSLYLNEPSWKFMRTDRAEDILKADDD